MQYESRKGYNRLRVSADEYFKHLDAFLIGIGIRSRVDVFDGNEVEIVSENPYKNADRETADRMMEDAELKRYKLKTL